MSDFIKLNFVDSNYEKRRIIFVKKDVLKKYKGLQGSEEDSIKMILELLSENKPLSREKHRKLRGYENIWEIKENQHRFFYKKLNDICLFCCYKEKKSKRLNAQTLKYIEKRCNRYAEDFIKKYG